MHLSLLFCYLICTCMCIFLSIFVCVATLMQFFYVAVTIESFIQELTMKFPISHVMDSRRICCA
jgi:hypothetical protein